MTKTARKGSLEFTILLPFYAANFRRFSREHSVICHLILTAFSVAIQQLISSL